MAKGTPGVRVVVARAWVSYLSLDRGIHDISFHHAMRFIIFDAQSAHPANIREYIEGSGGSEDIFAARVVQHIERTLPRPDGYHLSYTTVFLVFGLLRTLAEVDDGRGPLSTALLAHSIVGAITNLLCVYASSTLEDTDILRASCFSILAKTSDLSPSYPWLAASLRVDLVSAITSCAQSNLDGTDDFLRPLLLRVLRGSLVSHTVLSAIYREVDDDMVVLFPQPGPFRDPELFRMWDRFNISALRSVRILQAYANGEYTSILGCDNMKVSSPYQNDPYSHLIFRLECGKLCRKNELRRCSSCRAPNYCSVECQMLDWYDDGHRKVCSRLRSLRLGK